MSNVSGIFWMAMWFCLFLPQTMSFITQQKTILTYEKLVKWTFICGGHDFCFHFLLCSPACDLDPNKEETILIWKLATVNKLTTPTQFCDSTNSLSANNMKQLDAFFSTLKLISERPVAKSSNDIERPKLKRSSSLRFSFRRRSSSFGK